MQKYNENGLLAKMVESGLTVAFTVTPTQLKEFALEVVHEVFDKREAERAAEREETYLTTEEVCEMMTVTKGTLWRWEKLGYLIPYRVGRKLRYKRSDVEAVLTDKRKDGVA